MSVLHIDLTQVLKILLQVREGPTYSKKSIQANFSKGILISGVINWCMQNSENKLQLQPTIQLFVWKRYLVFEDSLSFYVYIYLSCLLL